MTMKWYIANVVAGQENKVCDEINEIAKTNEYIEKAFIPTKKVFKHVRGKKVETAQKLCDQLLKFSGTSCSVVRIQ